MILYTLVTHPDADRLWFNTVVAFPDNSGEQLIDKLARWICNLRKLHKIEQFVNTHQALVDNINEVSQSSIHHFALFPHKL
jgi:hypothetical protein